MPLVSAGPLDSCLIRLMNNPALRAIPFFHMVLFPDSVYIISINEDILNLGLGAVHHAFDYFTEYLTFSRIKQCITRYTV